MNILFDFYRVSRALTPTFSVIDCKQGFFENFVTLPELDRNDPEIVIPDTNDQ